MDVDTYTVTGRDGDLFLICSDGLTSMVTDDELAAILRSAGSLEETAEALVRAANQSGGKDNITVVLFRLGDDGRSRTDAVAADETIPGTVTAEEVRAAAPPPAPTQAPRPAAQPRACPPTRR